MARSRADEGMGSSERRGRRRGAAGWERRARRKGTANKEVLSVAAKPPPPDPRACPLCALANSGSPSLPVPSLGLGPGFGGCTRPTDPFPEAPSRAASYLWTVHAHCQPMSLGALHSDCPPGRPARPPHCADAPAGYSETAVDLSSPARSPSAMTRVPLSGQGPSPRLPCKPRRVTSLSVHGPAPRSAWHLVGAL